ncbi:MAG: exported protein of unknown function [Actinomycetia bacterium]|nr:exported protein of unknown function [Actinomycetes bacterium]
MGRRGFLAASVFALVVALTGYFVGDALAAAKPAAPTLTGTPTNPTATTTTAPATFTFTDSAGLTFKCGLDSAALAACASPKTYSALAQGFHTFQVVAFSGATASNPTSFSWAIVPPKPVIGAHPTDPTGATTATFTYTDAQSGVGFKCSLDSAAFSSCGTSGVTYSNLAAGAHVFQVEAQIGSNPPSPVSRFFWTVDRAAPTITVTFPIEGRSYNAPGWTAGCSTAGICGTATDGTAVSGVAVAIQQLSTGRYWNGSAFSSAAQVFNTASETTAWIYALARPVDGRYTVSVRATDTLGNTTSNADLTKRTFTIDTVAPAAPVLGQKPTNPTTNATAAFDFTDTSPTTFTCRLDGGAATACTAQSDPAQGKAQYSGLAQGSHCFAVFATDLAFNVGPTTTYCWTITATNTAKTITATSGTPQGATPNTNFSSPLVAKVTASMNNPVPNASVTFTAPASGASGTFASPCSGRTCVVTTNANGIATAPTFKANGTSGSYTVTATVTGAATAASFSLFNSASFAVSGNPATPFSPGLSQTLNLLVTNPNPSAMTIPIGGIGLTIDTGNTLCPAFGGIAPNFTFTSVGIAVNVPANTTTSVSLTSLGVAANKLPVLKMNNTSVNQDACKHITLTLHYTSTGSGS